ncbi:MAG TPA: bile acid:sodium symporter family protein [Chromatiales bacterium]|nr:bile acid:sodium symporter family protein [Chromatiales bacterium]
MATATTLFPLWALAACAAAWLWPAPFAALKPAIVPLLGVVMFGMGATLTAASFAEALRRPGTVALGVALQYLVMPAAGWAAATLAGLPPALAAGLILVGSCPGGTASNVICYLARGDVALSITLTAVSTLLAAWATPLLTWLWAGARVEVPVAAMMRDAAAIVLVPVALGMLANTLWHRRLARVRRAMPLVSVVAIALIIAIIVALTRERLAAVGPALAAAVALHNALGLALGYAAARMLGLERRLARTLAIEVGMQNSGLGVALAAKHFGALAALPGALFSVWHNLTGSALAAWWSRRRA